MLFSSDERKKIEKLIIENGGKYSAELTKKCTHLISDISFWGSKMKTTVLHCMCYFYFFISAYIEVQVSTL